MKEISLHFIWQYQLFYPFNLKTINGEKITIANKGQYNENSGPDFFNGKIYIDGILFAGNIEIHRLSSDWNKHRHNEDSAYDNVILHVVFEHDQDIKNSKGYSIPTIELKFLLFPHLSIHQKNIKESILKMPICKENNVLIDHSKQTEWLNELYLKRVSLKVAEIEKIHEKTNNNIEETIYRLVAKSFGFNINSVSFEMLAENLPFSIIKKYIHNDVLAESLIFGLAGFLQENAKDDYQRELNLHFQQINTSHNLNSLNSSIWKFSRMHPQNFPELRIAQFAKFLNKIKLISVNLNKEHSYLYWKNLLKINLSPYWQSHYSFAKKSTGRKNKFGNSSIDLLIVNCIVPLIFFVAKLKSNRNLFANALEIMKSTIPEKNTVTRKFSQIISNPKNGLESQALHHLFKKLCLTNECKNCLIGKNILNAPNNLHGYSTERKS